MAKSNLEARREVGDEDVAQAKFIILPTPNSRSIVDGIYATARNRKLCIFELEEPCSSLGERRIGVAPKKAFDSGKPCNLFLVWPGPDISLYGNTLDQENANRVAREISELIVYTRDVGGVLFEDSPLSDVPEALARWVGSIPAVDGGYIAPVPQRKPANVALQLYSRPNEIGDHVEWSTDLFRIDGRATPLESGGVSLDFTGPPRRLVQGPFLFLTPGDWQIRAKFSLDAAASKSTLRFDWGMPGVFSTLETVAGKRGFYEAVLSRTWDWGAAGEFIIELLESSIAGRMEFFGASITRIK